MDAAHKIGILSSLTFGIPLPPDDFHIEGISKIEKDDFKYAAEMGYTVKHLAVTKLNNNQIELRAHPALIRSNSYLANLKGVRNGIEVETDLLGTLHIAGSGAGQEATASGINLRSYLSCEFQHEFFHLKKLKIRKNYLTSKA
jgi:homoserine dehydrogenase